MIQLTISVVGFVALFIAIWLLHKPLNVHVSPQKSARIAHRVLEWILTAWAVVLIVQIVQQPDCDEQRGKTDNGRCEHYHSLFFLKSS